MNKFKILLGCFILLCVAATAQKNDDANDSLLLKQLALTQYDKDTSAEAVILSDVCSVYIIPTGYYYKKHTTRTLKIKILTQAGLSHGTFAIPLYNHNYNGEDITYLAACTYNMENGRLTNTPFNNNQKYEEVKGYVTVEKIAMPNVKVGSVIWISYTTVSPDISYFKWNFQHNIPVAVSEFNLVISPYFEYSVLRKNIDTTKNWTEYARKDNSGSIFSNAGISGTKQYDDVIFTYIDRNVPAFKDETFIASKEDYAMQLGFQLSKRKNGLSSTSGQTFSSSWKQLTDMLILDLQSFGGYLFSKEHYMDKTVEQLELDHKPQAFKIKTIVGYVKSNYKWNGFYSLLADKKMDDFITQKFGNSADINLFLTALLKAAGINARPVILSTREHGKIKSNYPFCNFFNDVVCYVKTDSLSFLLDGTEPSLPYNILPPQCANGVGYVVQQNDSEWLDLKPQMSSKIMENMIVKITPNADSINCHFTIKATGYKGFELRKSWNEGYGDFYTTLTKDKGMELIDSIKVYSLNNPQDPFSIIYSSSLPLMKEKSDSVNITRIIFSPFLSEPMLDNPFKMPDRKYPIDMEYPHDYKYSAIVVIPEGYKIAEKPEEVNSSASNTRASYSYKIKQISGNAIQFTSDLSFNDGIYQSSQYNDLKNLCDLAIKKCKEPLILEKK